MVEDLGRQIHDAFEHHRHERETGGPVLGNQLQRCLRIELAAHHHGAGHRPGHGELPEAPGVEHGRRDDDLLFRLPWDAVEHGRERPGAPATGAACAFGGPGCTGGQQDDTSGGIRTSRTFCAAMLVDEPFDGGGVGAAVGPRDHFGEILDVRTGVGHEIGELFVVDEDAGVLAKEYLRELRAREPGVQQERVGAEFC